MPTLPTFSIANNSSFSPTSAKKLRSKSNEDINMKTIESEYQSLIDDITQYNIEIDKSKIDLLDSNIKIIRSKSESLKQMFNELSKIESEVMDNIDCYKSSIKNTINSIKFKDLLNNFDKYYLEKNWLNADKCYVNATYLAFTDDMIRELKLRESKILDARDEFEISHLVDLIKKYISTESTGLVSSILKRLQNINLSKLSDDDKQNMKVFFLSQGNSTKAKIISLIMNNNTYKTDLQLNLF